MAKTERTLRAAIRGLENEIDSGEYSGSEKLIVGGRLQEMYDELDLVESCKSNGHDWELASWHPDTRRCVVCGIMREPDGE